MSGRTRHLLIVLLLLDSDSVHFDIVPLVGRLPFDSRLWRRILYCVGAKSEQIISWGLSKHSRQTPYIFTFWQSFNTNKSQNRKAPISASKGQKVDRVEKVENTYLCSICVVMVCGAVITIPDWSWVESENWLKVSPSLCCWATCSSLLTTRPFLVMISIIPGVVTVLVMSGVVRTTLSGPGFDWVSSRRGGGLVRLFRLDDINSLSTESWVWNKKDD